MSSSGNPITSIVLLLKQPRSLELSRLQQAANDAFRAAPAPPKAIALPKNNLFAIGLGPMRFGVVQSTNPYFADIAKVADQIPDFKAKIAVQQHRAWWSVDLVGEVPSHLAGSIHGVIGQLIAELLDDNVLGLIRLPEGRVIGYDFSLIPLLRNRKVQDAFTRLTPDRPVKTAPDDAALAAAAAEAQERLPEFVIAFEQKRKGQNFAVKKGFEFDGKIEHMWVEVKSIDSAIHGVLANDPKVIRSMKSGDAVTVQTDEVEDWIYTNGKENIGGFQAKVLRR